MDKLVSSVVSSFKLPVSDGSEVGYYDAGLYNTISYPLM